MAERVLSSVSKSAKPTISEEKKVNWVAKKVYNLVTRESENISPKPEILFGGSFAKGTWLKGEADIDIYMKFPIALSTEDLEKISLKIGLSALESHQPYLRYSEHPYVEAIVDTIRVNVVACFDVKSGEWRSSADRSPYHTNLIKSKFNQSLRQEVRILKMFLKSIDIYGAEVRTKGFSGYVSEVLIMKFGSFIDLLKAAIRFKEKEVITLSDEDLPHGQLHQSPLIILDPVDSRRNLGAAISRRNVAKFILASHLFLKKPSKKFFRVANISYQSNLIKNLVMVRFTHSKRSVDILWGQLNRTLSRLERQLNYQGFRVIRSARASNEDGESAFLFLLKNQDLGEFVVKNGPDVIMVNDSHQFIRKNHSASMMTWIGDDGRLYSISECRVSDAISILHELLSSKISESGIAPGLIDDIRRTSKVLKGSKILSEGKTKPWLEDAIGEIFGTDTIISRTNQ